MVCTHCPIAVSHFHWTIINKSDLESKSCLSDPEISVLHFIVKSFLQLKRYCSIFQRSNECFYRYSGRNLFTTIKHPECQILSFKLHWAASCFHTNDGATSSRPPLNLRRNNDVQNNDLRNAFNCLTLCSQAVVYFKNINCWFLEVSEEKDFRMFENPFLRTLWIGYCPFSMESHLKLNLGINAWSFN